MVLAVADFIVSVAATRCVRRVPCRQTTNTAVCRISVADWSALILSYWHPLVVAFSF
jgi:hypothetical protein